MRSQLVAILCLLPCSAAHGDTLSGVVLREDGQLAAGAAINVGLVHQSPPWRLTAQADEQGAFRIDLPPAEGAMYYQLAIRHDGQGFDAYELSDEAGNRVTLKGQHLPQQTIRLRAGGHLRGKLLADEDGSPIAGAKLFVDTGEVLTTDDAGVFEVSGLPMTNHSFIPVAKGRFRQYVLFDTTLCPQAELEIRLPLGVRITGKILDEQNNPIPGAFLTRISSGSSVVINGWDEVCESDGSFEHGMATPHTLSHGWFLARTRLRGTANQGAGGPAD